MSIETTGGYQAALEGCAYLIVHRPGTLAVSGPDRAAFFQRQTSNDTRLLSAGRVLPTVLLTPTARVIDFLTLLEDGDGLGAITLPGRGAATAAYLKSRIFFMDKVSVADRSPDMAQVDLTGPQTASALARLGWPTPPGLDELAAGSLGDVDVRILGWRGPSGPAYRLLLPAAGLAGVEAALAGAGCQPLSLEAAHVLRVEAGLPAVDAELTEDHTPLESGLEYAVSTSKGCYTGQEVIARQLNYDKVTRHLAGIRLDAAVQAGERVQVDGASAGQVTSVAVSPRYGPIALAVLHRPHHQPGTRVQVGGVSGEVTGLPFGATPS